MPNAQVDDDTSTVFRAVWDTSKHESSLQNLNNEDINHFINHMTSRRWLYQRNGWIADFPMLLIAV